MDLKKEKPETGREIQVKSLCIRIHAIVGCCCDIEHLLYLAEMPGLLMTFSMLLKR